jgi:predicted nucleic acid-binding Zn ribbon protein
MKKANHEPSQGIVPHKHCLTCGKVVSVSSDYCSPDCEALDQDRVKDIESIKFSMRLMIIIVAVALILNLFLPMILP